MLQKPMRFYSPSGEGMGSGSVNRATAGKSPFAGMKGGEKAQMPFARAVWVARNRHAQTEAGEGYKKQFLEKVDSLAGVNGEMVLVEVTQKEAQILAGRNFGLRALGNDADEPEFTVANKANPDHVGEKIYVVAGKEGAEKLARLLLGSLDSMGWAEASKLLAEVRPAA